MRSTELLLQAWPSKLMRPPPARASTAVAVPARCAATAVRAASWCAGARQSAGDATPDRALA